MKEKRAFERFAIEVPARINFSEARKRPIQLILKTDNLSAGGIFVKSDAVLPVGTTVTAELIFDFDELKSQEDPDGTLTIVVSGYVQRSDPDGTAICFNEDYKVLSALDPPASPQTETSAKASSDGHSGSQTS